MRIDVIPKFISLKEVHELNKFVLDNISNFTDGVSSLCVNKPGQHLVSRFLNIKYPALAYNIYVKLANTLKEDSRCNKWGIVVNKTNQNGAVLKHKDIRDVQDKALLRCNILTSKPEKGGELYVEGVYYPLEVGDIYFCLVSEHEHWVTKVEGDEPRIIWQFGFNVNKQDWNSGKIKVINER